MENLQTSNNLNHIWSTTVDTPVSIEQPKQGHYGLIYELSADAMYDHKACFFMVMGEDDDCESGYKPMTFDYSKGAFCWSYPCDDNGNGQFGEIYDKATAMKLISHHVLNSTCRAALKLFPVHIPFHSAKPEDYQNPYLFEGDSTELVEARMIEYMENYGYKDEQYYMPSTFGGELIGWGSLEAEKAEEHKPADVINTGSVLSFSGKTHQERMDKLFDYLRMGDKQVIVSTSEVLQSFGDHKPSDKEEGVNALTDNDEALSHWAFRQPLPGGNGGPGASLLTAVSPPENESVQPSGRLVCKVRKNLAVSLPDLPNIPTAPSQYYMITGVRNGQEDDQVAGPMTRHTECPLYFADTYGNPSEQLPSPLLFSLETAQGLIKAQQEWEEKNNWKPEQRFIMHLIPVFPDNGNVQIALIEQNQELATTEL